VLNNKIKLPKKGIDGFYGYVSDYSDQETEKNLRENVANQQYLNYLDEIQKSHSIPVMDAEAVLFLKSIPQNGWILDIGGCWGWHWRNVLQQRPDVKVVILDFIRQNLSHAKIILKDGLDKNFYLVHGNALSLDFDNDSFDGVWSVQTTQHIPNYRNVLLEVFRVLKAKGTFADYNLNIAKLTQFIYQLLGRKYHLEGKYQDSFFLRRSNKNSRDLVSEIFGSNVKCRYTEILFSPELRIPLGSKKHSVIGKLDSQISRFGVLFNFIARQESFHINKP